MIPSLTLADAWRAAPASVPLGFDAVHVWIARGRAARDADGLLATALAAHLELPRGALGHDAVGRPALAQPRASAPAVSLSHTEGLALVAIGLVPSLGVDVERMREDVDVIGVAEACFTPAEAMTLRLLPEAARQVAFFRLWTLKEAVVKATGEGVWRSFDSFAPGDEAGAGLPGGTWRLHSLEVGPDHAAALACRDAAPHLHFWEPGAAQD